MPADLTTAQAAAQLGVTDSQVRRYCESGALPARRIGGRQRATWFIPASGVARFTRRKAGRPRKAEALPAR